MKKYLGIFLLILTLCFVGAPVLAQDDTGPYLGLEYGRATGLGDTDVRITVARIVNIVLGLLGIISVVIIIYAGFRWMTSGGNEESVKSAQKTLIAAAIGLVIILSAYAISRYVLTAMFEATTGYNYNTIEGNY